MYNIENRNMSDIEQERKHTILKCNLFIYIYTKDNICNCKFEICNYSFEICNLDKSICNYFKVSNFKIQKRSRQKVKYIHLLDYKIF